MSRLDRLSPLGMSVAARSFENDFVSLRDERFIGLAKIISKSFSAEEDGETLRALRIAGELRPHHVMHGNVSIAWISSRERLLIGEENILDNVLAALAERINSTALFLRLNHQCVSMRLCGEGAREALSSLTPKDYHPDAFGVDRCARTLFGECGAFIQRLSGDSDFRLIIDQSYAVYAWRMLEDACRNIGASIRIEGDR